MNRDSQTDIVPLSKSAGRRGRRTRPSPGSKGETGGENDTLLLLQSNSWSNEGSNSGVSSSNITQALNRNMRNTFSISPYGLGRETLTSLIPPQIFHQPGNVLAHTGRSV